MSKAKPWRELHINYTALVSIRKSTWPKSPDLRIPCRSPFLIHPSIDWFLPSISLFFTNPSRGPSPDLRSIDSNSSTHLLLFLLHLPPNVSNTALTIYKSKQFARGEELHPLSLEPFPHYLESTADARLHCYCNCAAPLIRISLISTGEYHQIDLRHFHTRKAPRQ